MDRVLVLGAAGMFGHALHRRLSQAPFEAWAALRTKRSANARVERTIAAGRCIEDCDITAEAEMVRVLGDLRPTTVVNCAGIIKQRPEIADTGLAMATNGLAPHSLARLCDNIQAKFVQISTDCVFSGARGGYVESDTPDPVDVYGFSKLFGEVTRAPHLTLRTSMIGWQLEGREGLAEWFLSHADQCAEGWTHSVFSGLTTYALADIVTRIIASQPGLSGLYHVASVPVSKYRLLSMLNNAMNGTIALRRVAGSRIDRSLRGERFLAATGIATPSWASMLADMAGRRRDYDGASSPFGELARTPRDGDRYIG
jgi:dTDP-4-dehydrorhamnose reductase